MYKQWKYKRMHFSLIKNTEVAEICNQGQQWSKTYSSRIFCVFSFPHLSKTWKIFLKTTEDVVFYCNAYFSLTTLFLPWDSLFSEEISSENVTSSSGLTKVNKSCSIGLPLAGVKGKESKYLSVYPFSLAELFYTASPFFYLYYLLEVPESGKVV